MASIINRTEEDQTKIIDKAAKQKSNCRGLKVHPFSSELSFHIHNWLIINLKDFCIVFRKWPTFLPSTSLVLKYKKVLGKSYKK